MAESRIPALFNLKKFFLVNMELKIFDERLKEIFYLREILARLPSRAQNSLSRLRDHQTGPRTPPLSPPSKKAAGEQGEAERKDYYRQRRRRITR